MKKNKGQMNLETIGKVMVVVLTLAVLFIAALLTVSILTSSSVIPQSSLTATVVNESGFLNTSGYVLTKVNILGFSNPTVVLMINGSSGLPVTSGNYTMGTNGVITNKSAVVWGNVNFTYTYGYNTQTANDANNVANNASYGGALFFTNIPTIFTVLGVAAIIAIIGLLVIVIRRIRERESMSYT